MDAQGSVVLRKGLPKDPSVGGILEIVLIAVLPRFLAMASIRSGGASGSENRHATSLTLLLGRLALLSTVDGPMAT